MLRTKSGLPKHCSWNYDQHGKRRVRFRRGGFSTYFIGIPWSEDFMRQYAAALEGVTAKAGNIGAGRTKPGSFDALCVSYYRSPESLGLKPNTRQARRNIIERFRNKYGGLPVRGLERKHIKAIIGEKADTPEAANSLLKTLRLLLSYAVDMEMIASNPAIGLKRYPSKGEGRHPWTAAEIEQYRETYALGTRARLALELLNGTGQRKGDVVRMGWQHVKGDEIAVRQEKTDEPLWLPLPPELIEALASVPRTNLTFLMTDRGAPFTSAGFGNWFREQCDTAGLPHCSAHGLRKAKATRLANAGCSTEQMKAVTGHRSASGLEPYIRGRDQRRLARQASDMERAEQERNLVQPAVPVGQKGS
jgi:integrase